jgi:uncharacterized GH25 family protein
VAEVRREARSLARAAARAAAASALVALGAIAPAVARAHEYWLATSPAAPAPGDTVAVRSYVGTGFRGDLRPWLAERAVRFGRSDDAAPVRPDAARAAVDTVWTRVVAREAGTLVWYESNFIGIELPAEEFDAYLKSEGLDAVVRARERQGDARGPGRERYRRACKTWIAGADTSQLAAERGLPLEILALTDPRAPRPLKLCVLADGEPVAGALIRAWRQPLGEGGRPTDASRRAPVAVATEARTDAKGDVTLALEGAGEWLVSVVRMVPSARPQDSEWESTWASLTFFR